MKYTLKKVGEKPFIYCKNNIIVEVNNQFINLTGYSKNELIGKSLYEISSMLRINSQIYIENIKDEYSCYIFTQLYQPKEVTIYCKCLEREDEKMYFFKEKANSRIEVKFQVFNELLSDNKTGVGIGIFDAYNSILLTANQSYLNLIGKFFDEKEISIGKKISEFINGWESSKAKEIWMNVLSTKECFYGKEIKVQTKNSENYIDKNIIPVMENGKLKYITLIVVDVTENVLLRKNTEKQVKLIKAQKNEFKATIENISDALATVDKNYNYFSENRSAREQLYKSNSMKNLNEAFLYTKYYDIQGNLLTLEELPAYRILKGEAIKEFRLISKRPDGTFHFDVSGSPIYDKNGDVQKAVHCLNNVTEQVNKDEVIREQKEELEVIIENMSDALYTIDKYYNVTNFNSAARELVYKSVSINKVNDTFKYNDHYDSNGNLLTFNNLPAVRVLKGERLKDYRYTSHRPDGIHHISFSGSPVYDNSGNIIKAIICSRDITEQVNNDKLIITQKEKLEAIIENMSDLLTIFNSDGKFIKKSQAGFFHGTELEDIEKAYRKFQFYDEHGNRILMENSITKRVLSGEKISDYKMSVKTDKNLMHVEISGAPIYDNNGEFIVGILIIRDVTDKVKSEETLLLKTQLDLLNNMIENFNIGFVRYSYPKFEIMDINNKAYRDLKQINPKAGSLSSLKGSDYCSTFLIDKKVRANGIFENLIKNKKKSYFSYRKIIVDGKKRFLKLVHQPLFGLNNLIVEMIVISIDITDEIKLRNKMEETLKFQDEVFSNISHELKTPLNVIYSTNQLMELYLKNGSFEENKERISKNLKVIKQNCYRFSKLINNIVDLTKMDSGFFKLKFVNKNIVSVTEDIVESVAEYVKGKGIDILFDTNTEEKIIACDPEKIERVILNLISNAIKFANSRSIIYVELIDKGKTVELIVKDNGVGIDKKHLNNIFNRFYQVDKYFTRNAEGSGIGLSLVKSLVELHGGKISVESIVGEGSMFKIELPSRTIEEAEEAAIDRIMPEDSKTEKINVEFSDIYSI